MKRKLRLLALVLAAIASPVLGQAKHDAVLKNIYADLPASSIRGDLFQVVITKESINDFKCTTAPANPPSGSVRFYCDSGTGNITCLTSTGSSCVAAGLLSATATCADIQGSVMLGYDPQNSLGQGIFPCETNPGVNAILENPSNSNPNIITPIDLTVPHMTLKLIASQTQPFIVFQDANGNQLGYIDAGMNLGVQSLQLLGTALSSLKQTASPGGSAVAGFDFFFVGTDKLWHTKDDAGLETVYIGAASTAALTNKTLNCAVGGNVCKINGTTLSTVSGSTTAVQMAGTIAGGAGTALCIDGNNNTTTSACAGSSAVSPPRIADKHVTQIESTATALTVLGDLATDGHCGTGTALGAGTVDANFGANVSSLTGATANCNVGLSGGALYRTGRNIDFAFRGGIDDGSGGVTQMRVFFCVTSNSFAAQMASAAPSGEYACVRYDTGAGDTTLKLVTSTGASQTITDSTVTPNNLEHKYEIIFNDGTPNVVLQIDGVAKATNTTNLPAAATNLRYVVALQNLNTNNETFKVEVIYLVSDK
jgi:hypothetical protein